MSVPSTVVSPFIASSSLNTNLDRTLEEDLQLHEDLLDIAVLPVQVEDDLREDPWSVPQLVNVGHNLSPGPLGHPLGLQLVLGQRHHLLVGEAHDQLRVLVEPQQLQPGRHKFHPRGFVLLIENDICYEVMIWCSLRKLCHGLMHGHFIDRNAMLLLTKSKQTRTRVTIALWHMAVT